MYLILITDTLGKYIKYCVQVFFSKIIKLRIWAHEKYLNIFIQIGTFTWVPPTLQDWSSAAA
jgi:hypothetical protein